ncbi:arginine-tRNA-protein transferase [Tellurirhabdus bombi]|uniref:arginine-tRNA-protein transferase n=1 Tax=Tellurirhabdus bombi TaxID=2907205 RepID=UPI001F1EED4B|nr:arginine-tRNA-protein transferase [Tellurirhabdus bombi]
MKGSELDLYLSMGYFRMQQKVFTCCAVLFDNTVCTVHWLRIALSRVNYGKDQLQLLRKNQQFLVTVKPFVLTEQVEALYAEYKSAITFDAPESVEACLFGEADYNLFDTYAVEVRDDTKLIAVGIFDNGARSIAGIMNFYHPAYRKYSLGKYLMLQKINYARDQQKVYYYPGYLANNNPKFNYKLFASEEATEVFDNRHFSWVPFNWETVTIHSADIMSQI